MPKGALTIIETLDMLKVAKCEDCEHNGAFHYPVYLGADCRVTGCRCRGLQLTCTCGHKARQHVWGQSRTKWDCERCPCPNFHPSDGPYPEPVQGHLDV
jgi:hypothetical protein